MGWVIAGTMIVVLLSIALVVDLKDRGAKGSGSPGAGDQRVQVSPAGKRRNRQG